MKDKNIWLDDISYGRVAMAMMTAKMAGCGPVVAVVTKKSLAGQLETMLSKYAARSLKDSRRICAMLNYNKVSEVTFLVAGGPLLQGLERAGVSGITQKARANPHPSRNVFWVLQLYPCANGSWEGDLYCLDDPEAKTALCVMESPHVDGAACVTVPSGQTGSLCRVTASNSSHCAR